MGHTVEYMYILLGSYMGNYEEELPKKSVGRQLTDRLLTVYRQVKKEKLIQLNLWKTK